MNKIKKFFTAGLFVISTSLLAPPLANAFLFSSATTCEAANLTQALQGIGWSQAGVKNNATTSFFVVCPLMWQTLDAFPAAIGVVATFPGSTGTVECIVRAQNLFGGGYSSGSVTVTSGLGGIGANRGYTITGVLITGNDTNSTIVCALDPGEGIETVFLQ